ncbi:MAG: NAD(P)H-dependent glycerol-3-phosphate dehydrogenase [Armatimonadota bacterium]
MQETVTVLGAGSWGTALSLLLSRAGVNVRLWDRSSEQVAQLQEHRENRQYLAGCPLPETIGLYTDIAAALDAVDGIVFAVPAGALGDVTAQTVGILGEALGPHSGPIAVIVSKGIKVDSLLLPTAVMEMSGWNGRSVVLSGPNLATEVAHDIPAAAVAACHDVDTAAAVQRWFCTERFRVYASTDRIGVEVGGAVKNVLAVAAGISDCLGFGDNTKAALLTRGLVEMARLGVAMGAKKDTFYGLSGVGDLLATAGSRLSRNWRVGYALAQGMTLSDAVMSLGQVAEGVESSKALRKLSQDLGVEMPVSEAVYAVCYEGVQPREAVARLMGRFAGSE